MLQKAFYTVIVLAAFTLLTAMGGTGGFERAPRVEKNYAVVIVDAVRQQDRGGKVQLGRADPLRGIPGYGAGDDALREDQRTDRRGEA